MSVTIEFRDGVAVIDGGPRVLVTADYPYYRDHPAVWADRLRAVRDELGIEVITSYLPWRHHQPGPGTAPDFTGHGHPARNVAGFLELCHDLGLKVVVKPGPFIHAELTYGGLPDWVSPEADPAIEPLLDAGGEPARWVDSPAGAPGRPLPAPLGPAFLAKATQWLSAVGKEVVAPACHPGGPVIATQIANEGIYTNGALPLSAYDYSPSGLAFFRDRLRAWYGTIDGYNRIHQTAHRQWEDIRPPGAGRTVRAMRAQADWGRFHAEYLAEVYRLWGDAAGGRVPVVVNLNPPTVEELDDWLARVRPHLWGDITYGFTNWMGVVSANPDSQARYVIAAKRAPGPNMEENWAFSELYDRAYADGATSFHQTLLALAAGATGFNVYTGVSTSGWPRDLDSAHSEPYPDRAPVAADGSATDKAPVVRALADFFAVHGPEFLECSPVYGGAFGLYLPYAGVAALSGAEGPRLGGALRAFHDRMRAEGRDYALLDLETATPGRLSAHPALTVPGGPFMHRRVQELLAGYLAEGGRVTLDGPAPTLDEDLSPCDVLARALTPSEGADTAPGVTVVSGEADVFLRVHPERDVRYLTVLVQDANQGPVTVRIPDGTVELVCARGGAAVIRLAGGVLDDMVVKGVNGFLGSAEPVAVSFGDETVTASGAADLVLIRDRTGSTRPSS